MKKFIALFLAVIVCIGVVACNTKPAGESTVETTTASTAATTNGNVQTETTAGGKTTETTAEGMTETTSVIPVDPVITTENDPVRNRRQIRYGHV